MNHGQSLSTISGRLLPINLSGPTPKLGNANITGPDIVAVNGIVHIIDSVLLHANDQIMINSILAESDNPADTSSQAAAQPADKFTLTTSVNSINGVYTKTSIYPKAEEAYIHSSGTYVFFKYAKIVGIARKEDFEQNHANQDNSTWNLVYQESTGASNVHASKKLNYLATDGSSTLTTTVTITP